MSLFVVSMTLRNDSGDLLIVRKRGTHTFMLPGGKVEPGETHQQAVLREVLEEVGITLDPEGVRLLGNWSAAAANEPGLVIESDVFGHADWGCASRPLAQPAESPRPCAEIDEIRWLPIYTEIEDAPPLAPLLTEHVLPALRRVSTSGSALRSTIGR